jgi:uncharacterized protein (TIRG00374 family)
MTKKNAIRLALVLALTIVLLILSFGKMNWGEAWRFLLKNVRWGMFILVALLTPMHMLTRSIRWKYLMNREKPGVRMYNMFAANAVGFTASYIFPARIGELVKPIYLARQEKCRVGYTIGTCVVERIFDVLTMCLLLALFLLARPLYVSTFNLQEAQVKRLTGLGIIGAAAAVFLFAVCLGCLFFREKALALAGSLLRFKIFPEKFRAKALELIHEFIDGLKAFRSLKDILIYLGLSIFVWLGINFYYWIFFQAFDIKINFFFLLPYLFMTAVGASIPTPGMVGGYHLFSIEAMTMLFGMDVSRAGGLTIVFHAVQYVVTLVVGFIILWKDGSSLVQIKRLGEAKNP